ncbi:ABC transporter transmembrane domain-containing protein [Rheinheimera maricola]|uniref:ATP-binding cassette domain-containing protein n=1 Tax=Rheinheimera maricola TaxID=2793282 RepID=A0ABS7X548_9GAMM|nr:ABC transporter transmembrane domain-containing protein [Rheinheimera maricola]MBZ9610416.1 ATP-binding cassette domain-containing protein [Rheinheimera maricola]
MTNTTSVVPWLLSFLQPYRNRVLLALLFLLIGSLSWLALGQGVRLLVDDGFVANNSARLNQITVGILLLCLLASVAVFCRFYLMTWLGERVSADIRNRVYQHMLKLSPQFYSQMRTGEVISRFTADTTLLQSVVGSSLSMALRSGVTAIGGLVMMALTSFKMTALVLLAVPLVLLPIIVLGRKVRSLSRASQDKLADVGAYVDESLHEIHTVQAYGHETVDTAHFASRIEQVMQAAKQRIVYRSLLIAAVMLLSISAMVLISWVGAQDVMAGNVSAGELTAFMFYAVMVAGSAATISEVVGDIQRAAGAAERLIELAQAPVDIVSPDAALSLQPPVTGALRLQQLSFAYPQVADKTVLQQLSIDIKPGERIALVGPSGAGKTTLFQLLQRFYQPTAGQIFLDDIDISSVDLVQLRAQFALVPQESVIFATSVLENVRYGRPDASEQDVVNACIAARADEFIRDFSAGYATELGERGVRLSGGQKQRIAIARAILADRPVLLLDEATSALDAISEQQVQQALDYLMQGKTTLIIAHRLATVLTADRILLLEQGKLVASGSHQQLLQSSPLYQQLAKLQLLS